jgi:hypothetical protein
MTLPAAKTKNSAKIAASFPIFRAIAGLLNIKIIFISI